jgi:hypothetical protein
VSPWSLHVSLVIACLLLVVKHTDDDSMCVFTIRIATMSAIGLESVANKMDGVSYVLIHQQLMISLTREMKASCSAKSKLKTSTIALPRVYSSVSAQGLIFTQLLLCCAPG